MAATTPIFTHTEEVERSIMATLHSLSAAEQDTGQLTPEQAFDVRCALAVAHDALDQALAALTPAQPQVQPHRRAA